MLSHSTSLAILASTSEACRHIGAQCLAVVKELRQRSELRRSLGSISDRQLKDAGLIRGDLEAACSEGLSHGAAAELVAAQRHRAGNW